MRSKADKYTYRVGWSEEDSVHIAHSLEFPSLQAHGKTTEEALKEILKVVGATLRWMEEEKEPIPEPLGKRSFRGNLTLRIPPETHRYLAIRSAEEGVSINQYILSLVSNV
jgi:predicted HicB family RNase H-like nuclease